MSRPKAHVHLPPTESPALVCPGPALGPRCCLSGPEGLGEAERCLERCGWAAQPQACVEAGRGPWPPSTARLPLQDHPFLGSGEIPGGELHRRGAGARQVCRPLGGGPGPPPRQQDVDAGGLFPALLPLPPVPGSPQPPWVSWDPRPTLAWPRSVLFNPDGCCLYSGCQDSLRVYGWEPERCFDVVLVNWGKVADLAICNDQLVRAPPPTLPPGRPPSSTPGPSPTGSAGSRPLPPQPLPRRVRPQLCHFLQIGVAFSQSNVSSYVVDLTRVTRTGAVAQDPVQDSRPLAQQPPPPSAQLRRIYERPSTTCSKPQRWAGASEGAGRCRRGA